MPNIEQVPETLYQPLNPYHYLVDNVPLVNILARVDFVNDAVDISSDQIRDAIGTSGSLSNRLSSLNLDGSLKSSAIDSALHNIGQHTDGNGPDGTPYVRMLASERSKLGLVSDGATNLALQFDTPLNNIYINSGTVEVQPSVGIVWSVLNGNKVTANLTFPTSSIHRHYYDQEPQFVGTSPDYTNYKVSSTLVSFITGSLRVNVNGYLLSQEVPVDVPIGMNGTVTPLQFTEVAETGTFYLSSAITSHDIIRIDFDILLYTGGGDSNPVVTSGAQGPQGASGAQGSQGAYGGPQGYQGTQGMIGYQGYQGVSGNSGTMGPQGRQGNNGSTGPGGPQGFVGGQGVQGYQGIPGSNGSTGPGGPQGFTGNQGANGTQGTQGVQGTGSQGPSGSQGTQGSQGLTGGSVEDGLTSARPSPGVPGRYYKSTDGPMYGIDNGTSWDLFYDGTGVCTPPNMTSFTVAGSNFMDYKAAGDATFVYFNSVVDLDSNNCGAYVTSLGTTGSWILKMGFVPSHGVGDQVLMGPCLYESSSGKAVVYGYEYASSTSAPVISLSAIQINLTSGSSSFGSGISGQVFPSFMMKYIAFAYSEGNSNIDTYLSPDGINWSWGSSVAFSGNFTTAPDSIGLFIAPFNVPSNGPVAILGYCGMTVFHWDFYTTI